MTHTMTSHTDEQFQLMECYLLIVSSDKSSAVVQVTYGLAGNEG